MSRDEAPPLWGRQREREALDHVVARARRGESRVLVLRGEAGIGKTALLGYVAGHAAGFRIARASGIESEMELAFGGLHQLCVPMLPRLGRLPDPQRAALETAFGLKAGTPPDRFLVGLAVLSLLADAAEKEPLLCCVDDAQWLDQVSAQTLAFVARRLLAERVVIVVTVREPGVTSAFDDLPRHQIRPLGDRDARALLDAVVPGRLDQHVRDRIVAEARGNPLALLELPSDLSAGGYGLPDTLSLAGRIEQSFLGRVQSLPADTRRLLLTAAAEPLGDVALMWRAATSLGIAEDAGQPAEAAGLLTVDTRVRFRHPLVRSAAYRAATPADRREAHRALAEATDPTTDPDRRAWHRAHAAASLDEEVALDLERSADRAQDRGGLAAAAAFLERAAELTPDHGRRGVRAIAAGQALLEAGSPDGAHALLATAELSELDELQGARLLRLRAQIAFAQNRGDDALPVLLAAAQRLAPLHAGEARETCLEALAAALFAGHLPDGSDLAWVSRGAPPAAHPPSAPDLLLDGLALRVTEGYASAAPALKTALQAFRQHVGHDPVVDRWLWLACRVAADLFDHETWDELSLRGVQLAREAGALSVLPIAASYRAGVHMYTGDYATAAILMEESAAITQLTGTAPLIATAPMLAAYRGNEAEALDQVTTSRQGATARGQGMALSMIDGAHAVLCNGLGHYEEALVAAEQACARDGLSLFTLALVELVEAAVRSQQPHRAVTALQRLTERMRASGTDWALGLEARSHALMTDDPSAGPLYEEAVERLSRSNLAPHLARAQLVHGEWLRRSHERVRAREQLRAAHDTFSRIGAEAFAERARRELAATGETVQRRTPETRATLTAQEAQIAGLAADGLTNAEIGAQLFISPHTVEWHLRKVFTKLGVSSRRQLRRSSPTSATAAELQSSP